MALTAISCQKSEMVSDFTGNETPTPYSRARSLRLRGSVTFKERKDGKIADVIELSGTDGNAKLTVHLHLGDISTKGADVVLLMNPVILKMSSRFF